MTSLFKYAGEERLYTFDYTLQTEIVGGDTLAGVPTVSSSRIQGTGTLTVGVIAIAGTTVTAWLSGGDAGDIFVVECLCDTAAGAKLEVAGLLHIINPLI